MDVDDIFITKIAALAGPSYRVARHDGGTLVGEYGDYDDAVRAGETLATTEGVRLYFREAPGVVPQLLKDCRAEE